MTRDPLGIWGDPGQLGNAYSAFGNDPVNGVDPWGLAAPGIEEGWETKDVPGIGKIGPETYNAFKKEWDDLETQEENELNAEDMNDEESDAKDAEDKETIVDKFNGLFHELLMKYRPYHLYDDYRLSDLPPAGSR